MKLLIAIVTCHKDKQANQRERETWLKDSTIDYKFFLGQPVETGLSDEIYLNVPDDYSSLPYKVKESFRWALDAGYDFIYKCDSDTYVNIQRLLDSGFENYDFTGHLKESYIQGGPGYWISSKAARLTLDVVVDHWAEDLWVSRIMKANDIPFHDDQRLKMTSKFGPRVNNDIISLHDYIDPLKGDRMYRIHEEWIRSCNLSV